MKEKKDRVDDALCVTRAAMEEGVVAGGGTTYIRAQDALKDLKGENADEQTGINIVARAIEEPLRQIVANAGGEGAVVVDLTTECLIVDKPEEKPAMPAQPGMGGMM